MRIKSKRFEFIYFHSIKLKFLCCSAPIYIFCMVNAFELIRSDRATSRSPCRRRGASACQSDASVLSAFPPGAAQSPTPCPSQGGHRHRLPFLRESTSLPRFVPVSLLTSVSALHCTFTLVQMAQ